MEGSGGREGTASNKAPSVGGAGARGKKRVREGVPGAHARKTESQSLGVPSVKGRE